jgi:hypothetical protein
MMHLPDELADRLAAEAARRGISVDEVADRLAAEAARRGISIAELAAETLQARFPAPAASDSGDDVLEAFIGSGDSGDPSWAARPTSELRAEAYRRQAG